jgi:hypothetical protein
MTREVQLLDLAASYDSLEEWRVVTSRKFDKQLIVICLSSCLALVSIKLGNIC